MSPPIITAIITTIITTAISYLIAPKPKRVPQLQPPPPHHGPGPTGCFFGCRRPL